ncbi:MAG: RecX family transcriptional regulator [Christensenellaceae bacterium]|jgi:regulatory protein|nr:RecX family transcriptional regulator [Christensenellaceae bacterium]
MAKKQKGTSPMDAALAYLTSRPRTVREVELHLDAKQYGEYEVYDCVERLKELGYLNDAAYAADFIQTRLNTKPVSRRKLREQLYNHKLEKSAIETALELVTEETENQNAVQIAQKYWRQLEALPDDERKQRVVRRLMARGYDFEGIRRGVETVLGSLDAIDPNGLGAADEDEDE